MLFTPDVINGIVIMSSIGAIETVYDHQDPVSIAK